MTDTTASSPSTPLSYGQERLLWLHESAPWDPSYHLPLVLHFRRALEPAALEAALASLVRRHAVLGARYLHTTSGGTVQVPAEDFTVPLEWAVERGSGDWRTHVAEVTARPFDLRLAPGIRALVVHRTDGGSVLALVVHHIAVDGGSLRILAEEVATLHTAARDGHGTPPSDVPRPYADFAVRERQALDPDTLGRRLAYWRKRLDGAEPVLLPGSTGGPAQGRPGGTEYEFRLPAEATTALQRFALRRRAPLTAVIGAAFQVWLARHSGQRDLTVGVGLDRRPMPDFARTVGFFVDNAALRCTLSSTTTFRDLVKDSGSALHAAVEQAVPFGHVMAEARRTGADDIVNAFFIHHGTRPAREWRSEDGEVTRLTVPNVGARFDVELNTIVCDGELRGGIRLREGLTEPAEGEALSARFARLLQAGVADPGAPVDELPLTGPEEERDLAALGAGARPPSAQRLVVDALGEQVSRTPERTALVCGARSLTFGQLGARVARIARLLMARGVAPETPVGVLAAEPDVQITALFGILAAGGVFVPLDVDHPPARTAGVLRDSGVGVLLVADGEGADQAADGVPRIVLGDPEVEAELAALPAGWPDDTERAAPLRPANAAYVIHTSGSTGRPKGVCVEHRQLSALHAELEQRLYAADPDTGRRPRVAMTAAVSFDVSWQGLLALVSGCEVHAVRPEVRRDVLSYADHLRALRVDLMDVTPTHLALLSDCGLLDSAEEAPRVVTVAGEALPSELWARLANAEATTAYNYYGPTEATVYATVAPVTPGSEPNIGRPLGGTDVYVLDERLRPVPPGVRGEIYLAGDQVARGYLGRPDLTAARFLPCPFGPPGSRMYRTGDQGRWDRTGRLVFEGRGDGQVKLRGFRIELGEIEAVLARHPAVVRAAVLVTDGRAGPQLTACLTKRAEVDSSTLREYATRHLPAYMVPVGYVQVAELPLNTSGKLDRRALEALAASAAPSAGPGGSDGARSAGYGSPREETLGRMFGELLGSGQVGPDDDFFALGGHSLLVTRLQARIRSELGTDATFRDIFDCPTPRALAARLAEHGARRPPLVPAAPEERPPLSPTQLRLWFIARSDGPSATYNIPLAIRLTGRLHVAALRTALQQVVRQHSTLRTVHTDQDGMPYQRILPSDDGSPPFELRKVAEDVLPKAVEEAAAHPFDPTVETPLRVTLFRTGPEEHVLLLLLHHIAADGWSMGPLLRDLGTAYRACAAGEPPRLPFLPLAYTDYARWQRAWLGDPADPGSTAGRDLSYWRRRLADLPTELALPYDRPRPDEPHGAAGVVDFTLSARTHRQLAELAAQEQAGLTMVLQAAVGALLHRCGAGTDIPLGGVVSGRTDEALEDLVGFFVNTLVLRLDLSGTPTFRQLLTRVRETALAAYDHQDLPFENVVEALNPPRSLSRHPLFQTLVVMQPGGSPELPGLHAAPYRLTTGSAKFDLSLTFREQRSGESDPGGLDARLEYRLDLFDEATAQRLVEGLRQIVAAAVGDPEEPLSGEPPVAGLPGAEPLPSDSRTRAGTETETAGARPTPAPAGRADRTPRVDAMCGIFAELLGAEEVTGTDDFFALGGHSLLVPRLLARVRAVLGADLTVRDVFRSPTPAGLAACMETRTDRRPDLVRRDRPARPPLSPAQQRMWFIARSDGPSATYNIPHATRLRGRLNTAALRDACADLVARHEPLRTIVRERNGVPYPHALTGAVALPPYTETATTAEDVGRALRKAAAHPFDPTVETPLRVTLFRTGPEEHVLLLLLHHIAADGWSMGPLLRDLGTAYRARAGGAEPRWADLPVRYTDYAAWQRRLLGTTENPSDRAVRQADFWRTALAGLPVELALPYDRARPARPTGRAGAVPLVVPPEVHRDLLALANSRYAGLTMVLQAAVGALLHRCGAGTDIPLGGVVSGRTDEALEDLVGFFVNTLVLRLDLSGTPTFRQLLTRVRETALAAYDHQDLPFENVVEALNPPRSLSRHPLFQTLVVMRPDTGSALDLPGLSATPLETDTGAAKFDLTFSFAERTDPGGSPAGLSGRLEYDAGLFDEATAQRLAEALVRLLTEVSGEPDTPMEADAAPPPRPVTPAAPEAPDTAALDGNHRGGARPGEDGTPEGADPVARRVSALFVELLGPAADGVEQDFFTVGGNSLLTVRLLSLLRAEFGGDLTVRDVFENPTPAALAARLRAGERDATRRPALRPRAASGTDPVLAPVQNGLWFIHQFDGDSPAYHVPLALRLRGPLREEALHRALHDVLERHEALRVVYAEDDGLPAPRLLPPEDVTPLIVRAASEAELPELLREESGRQFDLNGDLPLRALLVRLDTEDHVLSLVTHHLSMDAWSIRLLRRDLSTAYRSRVAGSAPGWPRTPVGYLDYAAWHHDLLGPVDAPTAFAREQEEHWRRALADLPEELPLPFDRPRPRVGGLSESSVTLRWEPDVLARLDALATATRTSRLTVVEAVVAVLLSEVSGEHDVPLGTPVAGRPDQALFEVVGHFVNTVVVRADTSGQPDLRTLVGRVRDVALAAYEHQDLPFDRLVTALRPPRRTNRNPLFQTLVTWPEAEPHQDGADREKDEDAVTAALRSAKPEATTPGAAKFDLTFEFTLESPPDAGPDAGPDGGDASTLRCRIGYADQLFDRGTVVALAERLQALMERGVTEPTRPLAGPGEPSVSASATPQPG